MRASMPMRSQATPSASRTASRAPQPRGPSQVSVQVLADGRPLPDTAVLLQHVNEAHSFFTERTGEDGTATFASVAPGTYRVTAMHLSHGPRARTVAVTRPRHSVTVILPPLAEAEAATHPTPAEEKPNAAGSISGRVIDAAGEPVPGVQVGASGKGLPRFVSSDDQGRFELSGLEGSQANLFATAPEHAAAHRQGVAVGSRNVELVMLPAARVEGELEFSAVPDQLFIKLCRYQPLYDKEVCEKNRYYKPAASRYVLERAPLGNFNLVFSDGRQELKRVPIEIAPGQQLEVPKQRL